ncbi:5'-nucleotidase [Microbacterium sp. VKM Ac-2923]|uniref:5'-nucleotidase n=1 Tax=Microbacterium sp. VKM Ac-2923 TaxID=2929476 RepID=UPI001FB2AF39|nr:5'-nucleotidase [Microbacterium sp. VKM Ac-2923]MCJ1706511.1 5'-nucleotidase [Microbacterium sp. VKM Ac-2923]
MPYDLKKMLVIGVASSALFNLEESHAVFVDLGEDGYREYQEEHLNDTLRPGVAFPFIQRLLSLNDLDAEKPLVEVIVLSRNDPETGLRVMKSIEAHRLPITRAIFMQGRSPHRFMEALDMSLFLSANEQDVREALELGFAAGQVIGTPAASATAGATGSGDLRIAFDFDGVIADDSSEQVMQALGLAAFHSHEVDNVEVPIGEGRLAKLLRDINRIQDIEESLVIADRTYNRRVHVAIVTARNAPSHERVIRSLRAHGLRVNDAFFLGGIEKAKVLRVLRPHIFFEDQRTHLDAAQNDVPSVHVPFGLLNQSVASPDENDAEDVAPNHDM